MLPGCDPGPQQGGDRGEGPGDTGGPGDSSPMGSLRGARRGGGADVHRHAWLKTFKKVPCKCNRRWEQRGRGRAAARRWQGATARPPAGKGGWGGCWSRREVPKPRQALQQRCQVPTEGRKIFFYRCWRSKEASVGGLQAQEAALPPLPWGAEGGQGPRPDPGTGKGAAGSGPRGAETPGGCSLNLSAGSRSQR